MSVSSPEVVVIGAGIGGITTAAVLARAGLNVTVLEAHVYPGGCAGTFLHKSYRFDAGATLAGGFYPGGPMDRVAQATGIADWGAQPIQETMQVHLPGGEVITRYGDERRHAEHARAFGPASAAFFRWQEQTADSLWDLALRVPPWPPQSTGEALRLAATGLGWLGQNPRAHLSPRLALDALRPVAAHLKDAPPALRQFVDGQLLIAAQATSAHANALYGASALDLPRRGVAHLQGGMGSIARRLADAVTAHGGRVLYRHEVTRIVSERGRVVAVETKRHGRLRADLVVANLPPWNVARLWGDEAPPSLRKIAAHPADGWGAFMLHVGVEDSLLSNDQPLHHQVIASEPLGEGNSVFLSFSPGWDPTRAPAGKRALTISTHTAPSPWWELHNRDPHAYEQRKQEYAQRLLSVAERAVPGLRAAAELVLHGTPITFQRFTRRDLGWVGGFPQTHLLRTQAPRLAPNLYMVGDSIFPGQSTAAVALGGLRVAETILAGAATPLRAARHFPATPSRGMIALVEPSSSVPIPQQKE